MHAGMTISNHRRDLPHSHHNLMVLERRNRCIEFGDGALKLFSRNTVKEVLVSLREFPGKVLEVFTPLLFFDRWTLGFVLCRTVEATGAAKEQRPDNNR